MTTPPRLGFAGFLQLLLVVGLAAGLRAGYLHVAADNGHATSAIQAQGDGPSLQEGAWRDRPPATLADLVHHLTEEGWFGGSAPLSEQAEPTAHIAPGYPWLVAQLGRVDGAPDLWVRWAQCALGALTAGCL